MVTDVPAAQREHDEGLCAGLIGGCPACAALWRSSRHPADPPVCTVCGHRHHPGPAGAHAGHPWDDSCPYVGLGCAQRDGAKAVGGE